jgi:hypothetical protein
MTELRRPVRRRTIEPCETVRRRLVVALLPGDVLAFREEGRRRWYSAPLGKVFVTVARWNVDAERTEKRRNRKARP